VAVVAAVFPTAVVGAARVEAVGDIEGLVAYSFPKVKDSHGARGLSCCYQRASGTSFARCRYKIYMTITVTRKTSMKHVSARKSCHTHTL